MIKFFIFRLLTKGKPQDIKNRHPYIFIFCIIIAECRYLMKRFHEKGSISGLSGYKCVNECPIFLPGFNNPQKEHGAMGRV